MLVLVEVNRCSASIQVRSGSLVPWNIVPEIRLVWCRHALHW